MARHYNAFISYKHAEEDNRIAALIQRKLEHFHIPGKIRKATGVKRIDRVFRDKDELPITSDLSDTISEALENSDYLIVICSTNTKESMWVQREIEYFLRNHSINQVLTVLVNGEPQDVIPEILLTTDKITVDDNGNEHRELIPIEPLSCDYRLPVRRANQTELPRLASALIGCSYDDLINRRRQYRTKIAASIGLIIMALTATYTAQVISSKNKLHREYVETLKNHSKYLANESENMLNREQRITAILLALKALPKDENDDRPVTAEAVRALTDATLAYTSQTGSDIHASWNYTLASPVDRFELSPDATTLAAKDISGNLAVWDVNTHERILYIESGKTPDAILDILYISDNLITTNNGKSLCTYDLTSKEKVWELTANEDQNSFCEMLKGSDNKLYLSTLSNSFLTIDPKSGAITKQYDIKLPDDNKDLSYGIFAKPCISPDCKKIAFSSMYELSKYSVFVYDTTTDKTDICDYKADYISNISFADNSTLMVAGVNNIYSTNMTYGTKTILSTDHTDLICYETSDLKRRWETDFICNDVSIGSGFVTLSSDNSILYYKGNIANTYDLKTGNLKYTHNVNESIVDASDKDNDGSPVYITTGGGFATPVTGRGNDTTAMDRFFTDNISDIAIGNGVYVNQHLSPEIIYYGLNVNDDGWTDVKEELTLGALDYNNYLNDNVLAILSKKEDKSPQLTLIDPKSPSDVKELSLDTDDAFSYSFLGEKDGKLYAGYTKGTQYCLLSTDIKSGEMNTSEILETYLSTDKACAYCDGKLIYARADSNNKCELVIYDIASGSETAVPMPEAADSVYNFIRHIDHTENIYYSGSSDYIFNMTDKSFTPVSLPEEWNGTTLVTSDESGKRYVISDGNSIIYYDNETQIYLESDGLSPLGMSFIKIDDTDDMILVAYNNGSLYRYLTKDGSLAGKTDITISYNNNKNADFYYDADTSTLCIQYSDYINLIDTRSWLCLTHIGNCFGYNKPTDRFFTYAYKTSSENKIGYFHRYTTNELIEKAKKAVGNAALTPEQKKQYGIEE